MPEFALVSVTEAQMRTMPGRQGRFMNEYAGYIQQLSPGQAGKLSPQENENPLTIRRRLTQAAQALDTNLIIKRSGETVYFWIEDRGDEQPRSKRSYTRRSRHQDGTATPDQPMIEPEFPVTDNSPEHVARIEPELPSSPL